MDLWTPGVNLRPSLLAAGTTDRELRRLRRTGAIAAVRPGAYVATEELDGAVAAHLHAARAAAAQLAPGSVLSHVTAALLHGLPLWAAPLDRVHATRARRSGSRRNRHLHLHAAALEPDEVVGSDGLPITALPRTLLDLARSLPFEQALVPVDAALHQHRVTADELRAAAQRAARRAGNTAARQVLAFARPGAASPGETRSRVAVHRAGLPAPVLQKQLYTASGRFLGQVDFWWEELGVVGEFDGRTKYGRTLKPGQDPGEVVFAEKLREDAIRADGHGMARWTWSELRDFAPVARRIRGR
jgi:hypothetical protein